MKQNQRGLLCAAQLDFPCALTQQSQSISTNPPEEVPYQHNIPQLLGWCLNQARLHLSLLGRALPAPATRLLS